MSFKNSHKFFTNTECQYFPCHEGVDKERFNCLFCYCPLYLMGENCGGRFKYIDSRVKNCEWCSIPHESDNYDKIIEGLRKWIYLNTT